MFYETLNKLSNSARYKADLLKESKLKYLVSSSFAGLYVGLGIILIFTIGGLLNSTGSPSTKIMMGASFAIALTLVIITSSELFTGNNMIMCAGTLNKRTSLGELVNVWYFSYIGNLIGSIIVAALFVGGGLVKSGPTMEFFETTALLKSSISVSELFFRGILCNILVCVAIMCSFRTDNDVAKILIIFMCLFAFITSGFEHSVANMTIFSVVLLKGATQVTLAGAVYNLVIVTLGNIVGGAFIMGYGAYILGKK